MITGNGRYTVNEMPDFTNAETHWDHDEYADVPCLVVCIPGSGTKKLKVCSHNRLDCFCQCVRQILDALPAEDRARIGWVANRVDGKRINITATQEEDKFTLASMVWLKKGNLEREEISIRGIWVDCENLNVEGTIGGLSHEFAHCVDFTHRGQSPLSDDFENQKRADKLAQSWGFGAELCEGLVKTKEYCLKNFKDYNYHELDSRIAKLRQCVGKSS
ncbi:MAG: hypothetical protein QGD94_04735 [Planctomycetia bacterium]|nr:hypothetical protein [Planctomycetia bacterium]